MKVIYILGFFSLFAPLWSQGMPLPVPALLEDSRKVLTIEEGKLQLPFGTSETLGYNGNYLGPTIRINNGERASFAIENTLDEETTVHWHGLHVPAEFDGGPHQRIEPGGIWTPEFSIDQPAATLWYHPHLMGKTAEHTYRGLAGLFIIEDDYSRSLAIPRDYGVNDFPLILQDRRVDRDGVIAYKPSMPDVMHGYLGNVILTNGAYQPVLTVDPGTYRFRILNGSNSTILRVFFAEDREFTVIASDGGFLPQSVVATELILSPGERYEILADFDPGETPALNAEGWGGNEIHRVLDIAASSGGEQYFDHPESFMYEPVSPTNRDRKRNFRLETGMMGRFSINGETMDMDKINFTLRQDSTEVWTVTNPTSGMGRMRIPHSFHVHDVQFTVLSLNGREPPPLLSGPKDTIPVWPGDEYEIALRFEDYTGVYMYHCHLLEHEDAGMMGQFEIR